MESNAEYRSHLVQAAQKSIETFDKTLLSLAGGALAVSLVFVHEIVGDRPIECRCCLVLAWSFWALSLAVTLASFFTSYLGLRKAICQVDEDKIDKESPGGVCSTITHVCNVISGSVFLVGVIFMIVFAASNLR